MKVVLKLAPKNQKQKDHRRTLSGTKRTICWETIEHNNNKKKHDVEQQANTVYGGPNEMNRDWKLCQIKRRSGKKWKGENYQSTRGHIELHDFSERELPERCHIIAEQEMVK